MYLKFDLIAKVLCLIGCAYQSVEISKIYFLYKTTINVIYERNNDIELPGISICTEKSLMFKKEQNNIKKINKNSTIGQIFSRMKNKTSHL